MDLDQADANVKFVLHDRDSTFSMKASTRYSSRPACFSTAPHLEPASPRSLPGPTTRSVGGVIHEYQAAA
jgi:hypothetical protein